MAFVLIFRLFVVEIMSPIYGPSNFHPDKIVAKIPIHFEYVYPKSPTIQPKGSLGYNYYTVGTGFLGASLGVDIAISKKSKISLMVEKEIYQIFSPIHLNTFYSALLGTYYQF